MEFSRSTFTLEVNRTPTLVFQANRAAEAEEIGFGWAQDHSHQISTKGPNGTELPTVIKVRVARLDEKAAYGAGSNAAELQAGVRIVYLVHLSSLT